MTFAEFGLVGVVNKPAARRMPYGERLSVTPELRSRIAIRRAEPEGIRQSAVVHSRMGQRER